MSYHLTVSLTGIRGVVSPSCYLLDTDIHEVHFYFVFSWFNSKERKSERARKKKKTYRDNPVLLLFFFYSSPFFSPRNLVTVGLPVEKEKNRERLMEDWIFVEPTHEGRRWSVGLPLFQEDFLRRKGT